MGSGGSGPYSGTGGGSQEHADTYHVVNIIKDRAKLIGRLIYLHASGFYLGEIQNIIYKR